MITRSTRILDLGYVIDKDVVSFHQTDEETGASSTSLQFRAVDWELMGRPERVTVTIVPRDTLNAAEAS